jgi:sporulation protein YlmC with PRC-barrel domain
MGQDATSARSAPENQLKAGDVRASNLLAAEVRRLTGDTVGQVKELIVSGDASVRLAVITVGGVLGVGGKTIALPFDQLQVAPDGATLYLTLSEEELSARPAFDLENVTADNGPATVAPAAAEQQPLPEATRPGFVPSGTTHEGVAQERAQPAEPEPAQQAHAPPEPGERQSRLAQPTAPEAAQQAAEHTPPAPEFAQETPEAAPPAELVEPAPEAPPPRAEVAQQPSPAQPAPEIAQPSPEVAQVSPEPAPQQQASEFAPQPQPEHYQAVSKTKASNQPASALIGAEVVDPQQSTIGRVNDVVVTAEPPEVQVIVQLDESLAGNSRLVAVPLPELTIAESGVDDTDRTVDRVETELTIAQLEALPQFKY